ncbi:histidine kinase [Bordetella sputigena]|uniref:ATP-binding protein n=1 Tax=Bordetella sputigena TaxID=1416810 RepID=UPI0039EEBC60
MMGWRTLAAQYNSLRIRLLCAMLIGIVAFGGAWYSLRAWDLKRPETGYLDERLRDVARQIVESIPRTLSPHGSVAAYSLPDSDADPKGDMLFQVWHMPSGKLILRSPSAPDRALKPSFSEGYSATEFDNETWRVYALSDRTGTIQVQTAKGQAGVAATYKAWVREGAFAAAGIFLLLAIIMWTAVHLSLRALEQARDVIARRSPFDNSPLRQDRLPSEIRPFVVAINQLLARQEAALARERQLIADAAHELRTPLAAIQAQAQRATSSHDIDTTRAEAAKLQAVAARAARIVEQLLDQARLDSDEALPMEHIDLADIVDLVVRDFEGKAAHKSQKISIAAESCPVQGNIDALGILLGNLVDNAVRYTPEQGHITVSCGLDHGVPVLSIADDGPGIPAPYRRRVYDRFFRVPGRPEGGTGIGLSLVARIARLHAAELVEIPAARGFHLAVRFPAHEAAPASG